MPISTDPCGDSDPRREKIGIWLSLCAALIWPLQAAIIAWVLANLLTGEASVSAPLAAGGFMVLAVLRAGIEAASQRFLSDSAEARVAALRAEILTAETRAATASRIGGAGALAALASEKLEALRPYMLRYRPARLRSTVMPLLLLAIAAWYSWAVALVFLLAGPLIPVFMALVGWAAKSASEKQMVEIGQLSDLLVDRLAALSDLRLIGAGAPVIDGFADASESLRVRTMAVLRIAFLSSTVLELFSALGVAMVAIWVGFTLLGELSWGAWGAQLTPFAGIYMLLLAPEFFQPLRDLAAAWHDKAAADAVLDEMEQWRDDDRAARLGQGDRVAALAAQPTVRLRDVCLHRGTRQICYPDIDIAPGDSLAITGPSGCGKTTLLRLLAGLEVPETGTVLLGDAPLSDDNADAWRAGIGWMPQAPHFLSRSLRHNIGFGAPLRPDLLQKAQLRGVIDALPKGDLTILGERGAGLSGGEARRVTLARALHRGPGILLADEPTADLDAETADAIIEGLLEYAAAGGTLVVATHDPRLMEKAGKVLKLAAEEGAA